MTIRKHKKLDLANDQLESAIGLFVSDRDKFSVITLAGAADVIFCQLILNENRQNFTDHSLREHMEKTGENRTRSGHGRDLNDTLHINDLKHMDKNDDEYIEMDLEECAVGAILKAIVNHVELCGRKTDFVNAFLHWVRLNLDPQKYNINGDPNWAPTE